MQGGSRGVGCTAVPAVGTVVVAGDFDEVVQGLDHLLVLLALELVVRHLVFASDDLLEDRDRLGILHKRRTQRHPRSVTRRATRCKPVLSSRVSPTEHHPLQCKSEWGLGSVRDRLVAGSRGQLPT